MDGCTMKVLYTAEGARGSDRDGRARALKRELDGSETVLPGCYGVTLKPGERVIFYSSVEAATARRSTAILGACCTICAKVRSAWSAPATSTKW